MPAMLRSSITNTNALSVPNGAHNSSEKLTKHLKENYDLKTQIVFELLENTCWSRVMAM